MPILGSLDYGTGSSAAAAAAAARGLIVLISHAFGFVCSSALSSYNLQLPVRILLCSIYRMIIFCLFFK